MSYFALMDCNNFYASCERLFNPKLEKKPIVVLSNNDGCVIARSNEAKQLGIKMGDPFFKIKNFCSYNDVKVCSSNYALYGDLSQRVMSILNEHASSIEVYSIDEAFLSFPLTMPLKEVLEKCKFLRETIKQWIGLPVSFGIGPTKTLAKTANHCAKKMNDGIFELISPQAQDEILKKTPVSDIWGVGAGSTPKLQALGIFSAWDLKEAEPMQVRRKLGVVGERIIWELRGVSCLALEEPEARKNIACSRSFGKPITSLEELSEAISTYVNTACIKLRKQKSCASAIYVYTEAMTDDYGGKRDCRSASLPLPLATNDTPQLIAAAKRCLKKLFWKGERYAKCGVILVDLIPETRVEQDLFTPREDPKRKPLLKAVDQINSQYGKKTIFYAAMGINPVWIVRADWRSPAYTTCWKDLALVR